jgi:hypothetical protein
MIALLALYPLWWLLGLGVLIFPIAAVPMAISLYRRHMRWRVSKQDPVRLPPGFMIWLVFCVVLVAGLAALNAEPVGAVTGSFNDRIIGVGYRLIQYASLTVLLVYGGNLSLRKVSQRALVTALGWLFVVTVIGGLLGTFAGHLEMTSPVELLLPKSWTSKGFIRSLVHPYAAQIHDIVGDPMPRPAAPWGYTNTWGNNFCLLAGWFVVAVFGYVTRPAVRIGAVVLLVLAMIPVVHSLNRGLWIGIGVALVYLGVRQALAGHTRPLAAIGAASAVLAVGIAVSPLGDVIEQRLDNGKSNGVRMFLTERALEGMQESPVVGFGTTRTTQGGRQSITVGESEACERCGNFTIGGNGQLWQLMFAHGAVGTLAYFGFFLYGLWRFRRDRTPIGLAACTAIFGSFVAALWYNSLVTPLAFTFLAYVLLWRNNMGDPAVEPTAAENPKIWEVKSP